MVQRYCNSRVPGKKAIYYRKKKERNGETKLGYNPEGTSDDKFSKRAFIHLLPSGSKNELSKSNGSSKIPSNVSGGRVRERKCDF